MKRYEVCARGYAWLAERESADGLWVKYDEAAAECDELRQQLTKANTMLLFTRAERDSLQQQLAAAQEREVAYRNALMDAAKDFDQAGMGNCCQRVLDELNRIINAAEADHANN
jgi:hypothetical protein